MKIEPSTETTFPKKFSGVYNDSYFLNITTTDSAIFNQVLALIKYIEDNHATKFSLRLQSFNGKIPNSAITLLKLNPNFTLS